MPFIASNGPRPSQSSSTTNNPLTGLAWPANTDKKVDQSMVVNISMPQPAVTDVDPREAGKVLTYGAGIR